MKSRAEGWEPFTGDYEKRFYDVRTHEGTVHKQCWPNAGHLFATDGSGIVFSVEDGVDFVPSDEKDIG